MNLLSYNLFNRIHIFFKYIKFNYKNFKLKKKQKNSKIILCEFNRNASSQISFSYLSNYLINKYDCKCLGYQEIINYNIFQKVKIYIQRLIAYKNFLIYRSFNIDEIFFIYKKKKYKKQIDQLIKNIIKKINKKSVLINLSVKNVLIGDLIYDSYLRDYSEITVDLKSEKFHKILEKSLYILFFWKEFFKNSKVFGVIISDTVYLNAIIGRVASQNKIKVFSCNWDNIHKIDKNNLHAYGKFKYFKEDFRKLNFSEKQNALRKTKYKIEQKFKGKIGIGNLFYTRKNSFHLKKNNNKIIENSKKKKILIASHDFIDAPHVYGPDSILFPDFYEWLKFLKKISKKTEYTWYIKSHPHSLPESEKLLDEFLLDTPQFKKIPKNTSNHQILKEKIDCVLTVYGTIGWEYAYHNVPVINASKNNPSISYKFNLHAKNLKQYEDMILNFKKYPVQFKKKNIIEFYFMDNFFSRSNWMIEDYYKLMIDINGYENLSNFRFHDYWVNNTKQSKLDVVNKILDNFIKSDDIYIKNYKNLKNGK